MDIDDIFDYGEEELPQSVKPMLPYKQQRMLDRHRTKQDRTKFRSAEQRRRNQEQELYAPEHDYYGTQGSRSVPKSVVGYKPYIWPMIRFGLFKQRSRVGFDAEMRAEMGNITHEEGVSCFLSMAHNGGYLILQHQGRSSWTFGFDANKLLYPWVKQMRPQFNRWRRDGSPMDIFVLRGHLVSFGNNNEWLTSGSDGEYLLNTHLPYRSARVDPDQLWLDERVTLRQYYETVPRGLGEPDDENEWA